MASRIVTKTNFRLGTINVHGFSNSKYGNNVNDLVSILKPIKLDFLAVEEVRNDDNWPIFCQQLSFEHYLFQPTYGKTHGNGLASRYPFHSSTSQRSNLSCSGGTRGILQCLFNDPTQHRFLQNRLFAVTHLDHINEDDRLAQIQEFQPHKQNIDILMGDMNALTREDYSDEYYRNIVVRKREQSQWERPRFDLTKLITNEWGYDDVLKVFNSKIKDQQIATCDYGTRIDYIYVHPRIFEQWILSNCEIIPTKGATDHNAVIAEFVPK